MQKTKFFEAVGKVDVGVLFALPFLVATEMAGIIRLDLGRVYITERGQQLTSNIEVLV